jgi:hypothetical protein
MFVESSCGEQGKLLSERSLPLAGIRHLFLPHHITILIPPRITRAVARHRQLSPALEPSAPMPPVGFTRVTKQRPILDRGVWYPDLLSLDEHLHPSWRHPVGRSSTISVVAAIPSGFVSERRVDAIGFGGRHKADEEQSRKEVKPERHWPLSLMTGWRRSSERRETLLLSLYV